MLDLRIHNNKNSVNDVAEPAQKKAEGANLPGFTTFSLNRRR
jgi:hypothetical protein